MKINVLFIGDLNTYTESKSKCVAFSEIGLNVASLSSEKIPTLPGLNGTNSFLSKVLRKLQPMADPNRINCQLRQLVNSGKLNKFEFLWSDKAINISPSTLSLIKTKSPSTKLIFASGDNMAVAAFRNKAFEQSLIYFDAVITAKSDTLTELLELGAKTAYYIPKAFDENWPNLMTYPSKRWDISFVGSFEEARANSMLELAKAGLTVNVWGNGWQKWHKKNANLIIHGYPVYSENLVRTIEESKINLCFLRKLARDKSTNRTFEIPACGGFMLAENTEEQRDFFPEGQSAAYFKTDRELVEKCKYYLENDDKRDLISYQGHLKCLKSGYGYSHRCEYFIKNIWPDLKEL
ncbi:glycosyltransferase [Alphaproteobacteria bacterium]|nr:glycosyltransferase [Alphaproteobacteria bacterium]